MLHSYYITLKLCIFVAQNYVTIMTKRSFLLLIYAFLPILLSAGHPGSLLVLPNQEQLSSGRILHVMQDSEGILWYATEGGGLCFDDGRQVDVLRSDARHPQLLGSNNVACLAQAGQYIIVGTYHGAYVLDKGNYGIRRLGEVDDKRVDDILTTLDGEVLLTANQKIYHFDASLHLKHTYGPLGKYVAHLFQDRQGRIWATLWDGGLLRLSANGFAPMPWPLGTPPTDMADADGGCLWVGTVGQGIVRYNPQDGSACQQQASAGTVCIDLQPSADGQQLWMIGMDGLKCYVEAGDTLEALPTDSLLPEGPLTLHRLSLDRQGRLLVAASQPWAFALGSAPQPWDDGTRLSTATANSLRAARQLSARPTALATDGSGVLWFSTGQDIRRQTAAGEKEEVVLPETKDVSAMTFGADGTLWMGTIFGVIYSYKDGLLTTDEYASNEYGDAIVWMEADGEGRLTIVYDRYTRRYAPQQQTLCQQSTEGSGTYLIELSPTSPGRHWGHPQQATTVVERLPLWGWWLLALLLVAMLALAAYICFLKRQRKRFLQSMKSATDGEPLPAPTQPDGETEAAESTEAAEPHPAAEPLFLKKAIAQMESHLSDEQYSVEQLANDFCMSRMTFYRKIQNATGQKPTEFMRTIRLRRGAQLLLEGCLSVSEISYATGFASVSYFSRCFRTMYGVSPTQFQADRGKVSTAQDLPPKSTPS